VPPRRFPRREELRRLGLGAALALDDAVIVRPADQIRDLGRGAALAFLDAGVEGWLPVVGGKVRVDAMGRALPPRVALTQRRRFRARLVALARQLLCQRAGLLQSARVLLDRGEQVARVAGEDAQVATVQRFEGGDGPSAVPRATRPRVERLADLQRPALLAGQVAGALVVAQSQQHPGHGIARCGLARGGRSRWRFRAPGISAVAAPVRLCLAAALLDIADARGVDRLGDGVRLRREPLRPPPRQRLCHLGDLRGRIERDLQLAVYHWFSLHTRAARSSKYIKT
jgi:hypothetical protein